MEESKSINFYDIIEIHDGEKENEVEYILKNNESYIEKYDKTNKFVDPSYDAVFKTIFSEDKILNQKDGKARLINLLNSIIFPKEKTKRFTKITFHQNENNIMTIEKRGLLRFDISCQALISGDKKEKDMMINVEMQLGNDEGIIQRLFKYGSSLYRLTNKKTIVLAFINNEYMINKLKSQYLNFTQFDPNGNLKMNLDFFQIIIINLKEELEKIKKNQKVIVKKNELDENGICWIKLLGIRNWGVTNNNYYILPKNVIFPSEELKSTYLLLNQVDEWQLQKYINDEEFQNSAFKTYKDAGKKEQILLNLIEIFRKKNELFESMIDLIDKDNNSFYEDEIKDLISESSEFEKFIELLGKKRKINHDK